MLEDLFGGKNIEKILFFLLKNHKCYASQLKSRFSTSLHGMQMALKRLERGNILVSFLEGKTRIFQFNPRYPFLSNLKNFLEKAYSFLPDQIRKKYYEPPIRKRPRRTGKPLHL